MSASETKPTNANDTATDDAAGADAPVSEPVTVETLAAVALADLTVTQWNDSRIGSLDRASEIWGDFESAATDWFVSRRSNRNATRRAAIATARMAAEVVNEKGEPMWSAQASVTAWRVLYQDRVKPLYVKLATDASDPDAVADFERAVRRYIADRHLKRVAIAEYCMDHINGLGAKPWTTGRGAPATTTREALAALLADETPANLADLESVKWNTDLSKAVKPHVERQVVKTGDNAGNRQRGFEGTWTSVKPTAEQDTGGGGGGGGGRNVGQETYKAATDKLVAFPGSEHWNPLFGVECVHRISTADSVKFLAGVKQVKDRAKVVATLREHSELLAILADYVEGAGKTDKPSKSDVEKLHYVD